MFRGANAISLDTKGRIAIPAKYRERLNEDCHGHMVVTIDHQQSCLLLYPISEWEPIERQLANLSSMNPIHRRLQRLLLGHATDCELDRSGRILLPAVLREHAGLDRNIMLVGQFKKFEIWNEQTWGQQIQADMEQTTYSTDELTESLDKLAF